MSAFRLDTNELLLVVFLVLAIVALFAESLIAALISLGCMAVVSGPALIHSRSEGRNRATIKDSRP